MVNGTAKLTIDLGNSETRITTQFGLNSKGEPRKRTSILDNKYGELPSNKLGLYLNEDSVYTDEDSKCFKYNDKVYCNGDLCNKEFSTMAMRPSALEKKYSSLVTKLTLINAFCRGYEDIAHFTDSDLSSVEVDWEVTLLLPPDDVDAGAKLIAEMVRSISEVDFLLPELKKSIKINSVCIYPEGFAALIAVLFETKGKLRPEYTYLVEEDTRTLICDIGAGTSDFVMAEGMNIVSSTRFTKEVGGNNVHQRVRRLLKEQGITLSDAAVRKGCETGFVKSGAKKYDIIEEIATAKSDVSKQLVDAIQEFFENSMIPIQSIDNILVCGGGAENSEVEGIMPISNYIIDYMTRLSKDVHLVELPEIHITLNGEEAKATPRLLNIVGASILAE